MKEGFLEVNNDEPALLYMFNKDVQKMKGFKGWGKEQIKSVKAATPKESFHASTFLDFNILPIKRGKQDIRNHIYQ